MPAPKIWPLLALLPLLAACSQKPLTEEFIPPVDHLLMAVDLPRAESNEVRMLPGDNWQLDPMYDYLVGVDAQTGRLGPGLATAWSLDPTGGAYRFALRQGVPFHQDFGEFTAADVVASLNELMTPEAAQPSGALLRQAVQSVERVTDYEVVLRLSRPLPDLLATLSPLRGGGQIFSSAQFDRIGPGAWDVGPLVGTGPYEYQWRGRGGYVRYQRAPGVHWRQKPEFPEFEFRFVEDPLSRLAMLLTHEVQIAAIPYHLQGHAEVRNHIAGAPDPLEFQVVTAQAPTARVRVGFAGVYYQDPTDPSKGPLYPDSPMMDSRVRKALSKAINRDELNRTLFAGKGQPLYHFGSAPGWAGWDGQWQQRFGDEYGYDLTAARALLAEAGYSPARPLRTALIAPTSGEPGVMMNGAQLAAAIAQQWGNAGVRAEVRTIDPQALTGLQRAGKLDNYAVLQATFGDQWATARTYGNGLSADRTAGVAIPEADQALTEALSSFDERRQQDGLHTASDAWYQGHIDAPLFLLPPEVVVNTKVVSGYTFPGNVPGAWSQVETITATR